MTNPDPLSPLFERHRRARYLKLIAVFKIVKGFLLLGIGFSLLVLNSRTLWLDALSDWADEEVLLTHGKIVLYLLNKMQTFLADGQLRVPGLLALFYSAILFTEGIGVYLQKRWAEFLMVFATATLIPFELRHIYHHPSIGGFLVLAVNCFIVWFLARVLRRAPRHASVASNRDSTATN
jgi:putative flippase GtrA